MQAVRQFNQNLNTTNHKKQVSFQAIAGQKEAYELLNDAFQHSPTGFHCHTMRTSFWYEVRKQMEGLKKIVISIIQLPTANEDGLSLLHRPTDANEILKNVSDTIILDGNGIAHFPKGFFYNHNRTSEYLMKHIKGVRDAVKDGMIIPLEEAPAAEQLKPKAEPKPKKGLRSIKTKVSGILRRAQSA